MLKDKNYVDYKEIRKTLKPLDLIMFKGSDFVSTLIRYLQSKNSFPKEGVDLSDFSHCGLVVTSEILDHPNVYPGKIYIWESTISGFIGNGVPNIEGKSFYGTQLRDFDLLLPAYLQGGSAAVAICHLSDEFRYAREASNVKEVFTKIFNRYNGIHYEDCISLYSAVNPVCRKFRSFFQKIFRTEKWLFCSELIAHVYQDLGLFPESLDPENVVPMDFLGDDKDRPSSSSSEEVPLVVDKPIYIKFK